MPLTRTALPDVFTRLALELPGTADIASTDNIEDQARGVLSYILEGIALGWQGFDFEPILSDPASCPNCGAPADSLRTPYCGDCCKEISAFIRQFRNGLGGPLFDTDRQIALGQKLWRLLGGGLPLRLSIAPPRALAQVFKREEGKCEICGAPATTVDNIGSG